MSDLLQKGFLMGLGAAISGKKKLKDKLNYLVENDQLTKQQAKDMFSEFAAQGEIKASEWSQKQEKEWNKVIDDLGLVSKAELRELEFRIQKLEEKITEE
ncbi:phasin family protein [Aquibacillus rhizosphaerae]|uniref:Polyhydroxyalkanoate synthesis regulator n=1 Tax=Aquibacillus rhizosphaerae TaxID=3051431 RepID=A0ABT7L8V7_9BACI|nr:hypothetical protein [Aquibacillus sp. LR5S19]MDL4842294.1 hypothetical protein [Aquibacillus sp. LR5S19]